MRKNNDLKVASVLASVLLVGCGGWEGPSGESTNSPGSPEWEVAENQAEPGEQHGPGEQPGPAEQPGPGEQPGPFEPGGEALYSSLCMPRANPSNVRVLELSDDLLENCGPPGETVELDGEDLLTCSPDEVVWDTRSTVHGRLIRWTLDGDRIQEVTVKRPIQYSPDEFVSTWYFDDQEQMVEYTSGSTSGGVETYQVLQTFEGEHLVLRRQYRGASVSEIHWEYEDDRLVRAMAGAPEDPSWEVEYRYESGQPVEIERRFHGDLRQRQSWQWDQDGRLLSRSNWVNATENIRTGIDTYESLQLDVWYAGYGPDPFEGSLFVADHERECMQPPVTVSHGYPMDENAYHIGWPGQIHSDHFTIAFVYQGRGMYYTSGIEQWFGHDGAGFIWPGAMWVNGVFETTLDYDSAQRMVSEEVHFESAGEIYYVDDHFSMLRARTFSGQQLVEDWVRLSPGEDEYERSIFFEHDSHGRLVVRELVDDDEVFSRQEWTFDDEGRATELAVRVTDARDQQIPRLGRPVLLPEGTLQTRGWFSRLFGPSGLLKEKTAILLYGDTEHEWGRRFHYDEDGELIETESF